MRDESTSETRTAPVDIERQRFREEFRTLQLKLQERGASTNELPMPVYDVMRPERQHVIKLVVEDSGRFRGRKTWLLPQGVLIGGKIIAACVLVAAIYYGPPYYTCRQLKDQGMFYYGTTVRSCVQGRLEARANSLEAVSRVLLPVL